jgi:DNA polymerase III delta subunit
LATLILITGEEEFLKERAALEEGRSSLCSSHFVYRLPSDTQEYLMESQSVPIFGGSRSFVTLDADEVPPLPVGEDDVLIVCSSGKKLEDTRAKRVLNFPRLKSFDDKNEVIAWILKEGKSRNLDLNRVAVALFLNCGIGLRKLDSEIEKLSVVTRSGVVSPEDAKSVMCFCADLTPRYIIDAICDGHTARALAFYDRLQEKGDETGWIIAYMQRHVLQQLQMETLFESGVHPSEIASSLGVHPFILKKMMDRRLGLWARSSLIDGLSTLCDLDVAQKRGNTCARFGLETEIIRMSEEARNVKR